jgi:hypothetical protein
LTLLEVGRALAEGSYSVFGEMADLRRILLVLAFFSLAETSAPIDFTLIRPARRAGFLEPPSFWDEFWEMLALLSLFLRDWLDEVPFKCWPS